MNTSSDSIEILALEGLNYIYSSYHYLLFLFPFYFLQFIYDCICNTLSYFILIYWTDF